MATNNIQKCPTSELNTLEKHFRCHSLCFRTKQQIKREAASKYLLPFSHHRLFLVIPGLLLTSYQKPDIKPFFRKSADVRSKVFRDSSFPPSAKKGNLDSHLIGSEMIFCLFCSFYNNVRNIYLYHQKSSKLWMYDLI